jgi:hypothetical protein
LIKSDTSVRFSIKIGLIVIDKILKYAKEEVKEKDVRERLPEDFRFYHFIKGESDPIEEIRNTVTGETFELIDYLIWLFD